MSILLKETLKVKVKVGKRSYIWLLLGGLVSSGVL